MLSEVANHKTYKSVLERLKTSLNTIFCLINRILQKNISVYEVIYVDVGSTPTTSTLQ